MFHAFLLRPRLFSRKKDITQKTVDHQQLSSSSPSIQSMVSSSSSSCSVPAIIIRLKLCYHSQTKLFHRQTPLSFSDLLILSAEAFPASSAPHHPPLLTYLDPDGDEITIDDDHSLHLAIRSLSADASSASLKVHITQASPQNASRSSSIASGTGSPKVAHVSVNSRSRFDQLVRLPSPSTSTNAVTSSSAASRGFRNGKQPASSSDSQQVRSAMSSQTATAESNCRAGHDSGAGGKIEPQQSSPSSKPIAPASTDDASRSSAASRRSRKGKQASSSSSTAQPVVQQRRAKFCPHFRSGTCYYGSNCKYVHDDNNVAAEDRPVAAAVMMERFGATTTARPQPGDPLSESDMNTWLNARIQASEHDNITFLRSSQGFDSFLKLIHQKNLPDRIIEQLVKLLVRQKFRTSLLREDTDKVYRALLGSEFLTSLHAHVRCNVPMAAARVEPYVQFCEELMKRCSDGWKEAPLDELRGLVEDMEGGNDLRDAVDRLREQRRKEKRTMSGGSEAGGPSSTDFGFRSLPLIPGMDQLLLPVDRRCKLPVNLVGSRYPTLASYLDSHFRLMQEDCLSSLRDGILKLRNRSKDVDLRIYKDVKLVDILCGPASIVYRISFPSKASLEKSSKRLMRGSLLCISSDSFQTFVWGVVAERKRDDDKRERRLSMASIDVRLLEKINGGACRLEDGKTYVMVESTAAYFAAYSHVLLNLQRPEMDQLPFGEHLLFLEPLVKEPGYIKSRNLADVYDFGDAFPDMRRGLTTTRFHILQNWPSWSCSLDSSQMAALRHGLTKRLALIQGPPGTGKTFVGLTIVKILLHNLKPSAGAFWGEDDTSIGGPILVICYTNHALDQFMKGIFEMEKNIVRVGGRSKCHELETCKLDTLRRDFTQPHLRSLRVVLYATQKQLKDQITECRKKLKLRRVTRDSLQGIATPEQIRSLFYQQEDSKSTEIVNKWLTASDFMPSKRRRRRRRGREARRDSNTNRYQLLESSETAVDDLEEASVADSGASDHEYARPWDFQRDPENAEDGMVEEQEIAMGIIAYDQNQDSSVASDSSAGDGTDRDEEEEGSVGGGSISTSWTTKSNSSRRHGQASPAETHRTATGPEEAGGSGSITSVDHLPEDCSDVWSLDVAARQALHERWLRAIKQKEEERFDELAAEYEASCKKLKEVEDEIDLTVLRKAKVVGMTTTRAASHHDILESLQAEVIVVEEAAEVLESHVLACLTASTKHLILIGDHLQLRPSVATYSLAVKHRLDVSLFERLVHGGVEYVTLNVQRRMRPSISKLISSLYPRLADHPSTSLLEHVKGVKSDVFFFHHDSPEEYHAAAGEVEESSKRNIEEAKLVVELCAYLLRQGYSESDITILSMYNGQAMEISRKLHTKLRGAPPKAAAAVTAETKAMPRNDGEADNKDGGGGDMPRISSVDDYQGEECKIILLSLVRSNALPSKGSPGRIGFLGIANRVCVALSRAKNGLFIFGNGELLREKNGLWAAVIAELRSSGSYGDSLVLSCQNHPGTETRISRSSDFLKVPDGGCSRPCEEQLSCGHVCPKRCHPDGSHDSVVCSKQCSRRHGSCRHQCQSLCHGFSDCPPCKMPVKREHPVCGHAVEHPCSMATEDVICKRPCQKRLPECGHECRNVCGVPCTERCRMQVKKTLPCGHEERLMCYDDASEHECSVPCRAILPDCGHYCRGTCGKCRLRGGEQQHIPCQEPCDRISPCGHRCSARCHNVCPPCSEPCLKRCVHSRCPLMCGYPCVPCMEPCDRRCPHVACDLLCHEICQVACCDYPCPKFLRCGHRCMGLCGEPCPDVCVPCRRPADFMDVISQMTIHDLEGEERMVRLLDCGHMFEVDGLDTWMRMEEPKSASIQPKLCPQCRIPVLRSRRYANDVKRKQMQIQEVKKHILLQDQTNEGIRLLHNKEYVKALDKFVAVIEEKAANYETYYALGCALCAVQMYECGAQLLRCVAKKYRAMKGVTDGVGLRASMMTKEIAASSLLKASDATSSGVRRRSMAATGAGHVVAEKIKGIVMGSMQKQDELEGMMMRQSEAVRAETAMKAMVQWGSAMTNVGRYEEAEKLCRAVMAMDGGNNYRWGARAKEVVEMAKKGQKVRQEVVAAMVKEVGGRGHWYQCPNGHFYVVGECGGPMEESRCPECDAKVGGTNHRPADGNTHSRIDGSSDAAYGNHVGLGNFRLFPFD